MKKGRGHQVRRRDEGRARDAAGQQGRVQRPSQSTSRTMQGRARRPTQGSDRRPSPADTGQVVDDRPGFTSTRRLRRRSRAPDDKAAGSRTSTQGRPAPAARLVGAGQLRRRAGSTRAGQRPGWRCGQPDDEQKTRSARRCCSRAARRRCRGARSTSTSASARWCRAAACSFVTVPDTIVEIHPAWRGYSYFIVDDEIIIVEPSTFKIVAVLTV